jgi:hypothetical protein
MSRVNFTPDRATFNTTITQPCNATITQPCNSRINNFFNQYRDIPVNKDLMGRVNFTPDVEFPAGKVLKHATEQSRNLATQQSRNFATQQSRNLATITQQ